LVLDERFHQDIDGQTKRNGIKSARTAKVGSVILDGSYGLGGLECSLNSIRRKGIH